MRPSVTETSLTIADIDAESLDHARANVTRNALDDRIAIGANDPTGPIFPAQLATLCPVSVPSAEPH